MQGSAGIDAGADLVPPQTRTRANAFAEVWRTSLAASRRQNAGLDRIRWLQAGASHNARRFFATQRRRKTKRSARDVNRTSHQESHPRRMAGCDDNASN